MFAIMVTVARAPRTAEPEVASSREDATRLMLVEPGSTSKEVLYDRVAPVVNRMVWLYLATDPDRDDVAQDIHVAIMRGVGSVRDPALLEGWAARVAFNTISNVFRRRKLVRWLSLEALGGYEPPDGHTDFEGRELVARTQKVLEHLPVRERMPFTLMLLGNADMDEIGKLCECSPRTVRRRLRDARSRFERLAARDPALASRLGDAGSEGNHE
jgi:RNA polymerase sigma factor (sigma-70 family)